MAGSSMRGGRTRKFKSEINVVPYIDVMLVLLIIFMVASPVTDPSVINLPNAGNMPVMIAADKTIQYDEVIQVISEAKKLGITRVGLATK